MRAQARAPANLEFEFECIASPCGPPGASATVHVADAETMHKSRDSFANWARLGQVGQLGPLGATGQSLPGLPGLQVCRFAWFAGLQFC